MKTAGSKTVAKKKAESKGSHKLKHVIMTPIENGVMAEHHFHEPPMSPTGHYVPPPEPERHALMSKDDMAKHMADTFPMGESSSAPAEDEKTAKAKGVGKSGKEVAADKEPDADEDDED